MTAPVWHVDAILFDSDGVLVDSHAEVLAAWTLLATELAIEPRALLAGSTGVPARQTLARHLTGRALDRAVERLEELEVAGAAATRAIAGASEMTAALPADGFAIVTSASRRLGEARWSAASIRVPHHVVTADDVSRGKPDPEPFLIGAARLGVDPRHCLVVEDSPAGGRAARAAGAAVVALGGHRWDDAPDARIADLHGLRVVPETDGSGFTVTVVDRVG